MTEIKKVKRSKYIHTRFAASREVPEVRGAEMNPQNATNLQSKIAALLRLE
jgi:hypothetical protein